MSKTQTANPQRLFRSILCPVDFSEPATAALRYAASVAKRTSGRLFVLHVNDPMLAAAAAIMSAEPDYATVALSELRSFVGKGLSATMRKALPIRYAVETGDPVRKIASAAERFQCDLVVM